MVMMHPDQQVRGPVSQLETLSTSGQPGVKVEQSIQHQLNPTPSIVHARHCFQQRSSIGLAAAVWIATIFSFHMSDT